MKPGDLLFCYGTLRRGQSNDLSQWGDRADALQTYLGEDKISGRLYGLGSYPGVQGAEDFDYDLPSVSGDVFLLSSYDIITSLDGYEGYPSLYDRKQVLTEAGLRVWAYTYNGDIPDERLIPEGVWPRPSNVTVRSQSHNPILNGGVYD